MFSAPRLVSALALLSSVAFGYQCQSAAVIGADETLFLGAKVHEPFSYEINRQGSSYLSLHFASVNIPVGAYLTISTPDGTQMQEYTNFTQSNFYAEYIQGDSIFVTYTPSFNEKISLNSDEQAFFIDKFAHGFPIDSEDNLESVCGKDNTQAAVCLRTFEPVKYQTSQAVARLMMAGKGLCTGWLFGSEGHLITNNHCIGDASTAANTQFEFEAQCSKCDDPNNSVRLGCKGKIVATSSEFIYTSAANDFTLVKLNLKPGVSLAKYGYLQGRSSGPALGEPIYIPQHPRGKPGRIATILDNGDIGTVESLSIPSCVADEIGYTLDTEPGASGSPVISTNDNAVVALHNCGGCLNGGVKISSVIAELTKAKVLPEDALIGSNPPTSPVTTSAAPVTLDPSTEAPTSVTPITPTPSGTKPVTPVPTSNNDCHGCTGCYSQLLNYCFPSGYSQAQCASFTDYKTIWCGE